MPKNRTGRKSTDVSVSAVPSVSADVTKTTLGGSKIMAGEVLSLEQINTIRSKARTKGTGELVLQSFLERAQASGDSQYGEAVDLKAGDLGGKSAESAVATLNNAKNKTRKAEDGQVAYVNPQFQRILVKKVGKGDEAIVALIWSEA